MQSSNYSPRENTLTVWGIIDLSELSQESVCTRSGFSLPTQASGVTTADFAVLDIPHGLTIHHSFRICSSILFLKLLTEHSLPLQKSHCSTETRCSYEYPMQITQVWRRFRGKHCVLWIFSLSSETAGSQQCYANRSVLFDLWGRVQLYKPACADCITFCISRITKFLSYIHIALLFPLISFTNLMLTP